MKIAVSNPCQCGCGQDAGVYERSSNGRKVGEPRPLYPGHRRHAGPPGMTVKEKYAAIQRLWNEGRSEREIATELKVSAPHISNCVSKMRSQGWDIPYRFQRDRFPDLRSVPVGHGLCPRCGSAFERNGDHRHCGDCRRLLGRAHDAVRRALRLGRLHRPSSCGRCGFLSPDLHAHHDDYSKPLAVEWLCPGCHARETHKARHKRVGYYAGSLRDRRRG